MVELAKAIRRIGWGYILIHFHINLGRMDILPDFLGFYLMVLGIWTLRREVESAGLLESFGIFLVGWNLLTWILTLLGAELSYPIVHLFVNVVSLYFHFQLQTDIAVIADRYETERGGFIRFLRTVYTVLTTALFLRVLLLDTAAIGWVSTAAMVVTLLAAVVLFVQLRGLARDIEDLEEDDYGDPEEEV